MKEGTIVKEGIKNKVDLLVLNRQKVEKEFNREVVIEAYLGKINELTEGKA